MDGRKAICTTLVFSFSNERGEIVPKALYVPNVNWKVEQIEIVVEWISRIVAATMKGTGESIILSQNDI